MNMISIIVVAIVFIALCVFVYLAAKTWHWINILFLMLTFVAGLAAAIGLAQVGELRNNQQLAAQKAADRAEKLINDAERAVEGASDSFTFDPKSLRGVSQQLDLMMAGRGRVWSSGVVAAADANGKTLRTFKFSKARPAGENAFVSLKNVILYAFADGNVPVKTAEGDNQAAPRVPILYVGSVRVIEETPELLTLEGEFISDAEQFETPTTTWSLFEKMPLDRRGTLQEAYRQANEDLGPNEVIETGKFRQFLMAGLLNAERLGMDPNGAPYEELLDRYTFDGMALGKIRNWVDAQSNRVSNSFDPSPEEVFVRYRFEAKSRKTYQVDANGSLETDGIFTQGGQAVDSSLHLGKDVEFEEGDTLLVDQVTADGYSRNEGTQVPPFASTERVTELERVYVRRLRDYPYMLASITRKAAEFEEEIVRRQRSNQVQTATVKDTQTQLNERTQLTADLEDDNSNLQQDKNTVEGALQTKNGQVDDLQTRITDLESQIDRTHSQIRTGR